MSDDRTKSELRRELEAFLAVDPETVEGHEPLIRAVIEILRDRTAIAVRGEMRELTESERGDLDEAAKPRWKWVDGLNRLPPGTIWDLTDENVELWRRQGEPRQVWIRWDILTPQEREVAVSAATFLVGILRGTGRTGRPRGSRLLQAEQHAVEALGERLWSMPWHEGVETMIRAGAWKAKPTSRRDAKDRRALRARWNRLLTRVRGIESGREVTENTD